jgi:transposase
MAFKIYTDYDYLYSEYVKKKRSCKEIADEHGVTEMTVYNWCQRHDLLKYRGKGRRLGSRTISKRR